LRKREHVVTLRVTLLEEHTTVSENEHDRPQTSVMVAVGINPHSQRLLDAAARLAQGLDATLLAVHVHQPNAQASLYRSNLDWQFGQARARGARTDVIEGQDVAATLVEHAQRRGVTHLVIGQSDVSRWHEIRYGSIVNHVLREIARQHVALDLYIVTSTSGV
jgi:two-component system sensor histidine kinase KdpD